MGLVRRWNAGKNASLYLAKREQPAALRAAGSSAIELLHDEGGMALYSAYRS